MLQRKTVVGVMALALLVACAKQAPPPQPADRDGDEATTAVPAAPPEGPQRRSPAEKAAGLLQLIDTAPQCETFRARLEEAGRAPADSAPTIDAMNSIVAEAHEAGCSRKLGKQ